MAARKKADPGKSRSALEAEQLKRLGAFLRALREARGWPQKLVAMEAGLSQSTVCKCEGGHYDGRILDLDRILHALGSDLPTAWQMSKKGHQVVIMLQSDTPQQPPDPAPQTP